MSRVKSAQEIMGSLLKVVWAGREALPPDRLTHVTLMSCFDRKLEASRPDFRIQPYAVQEVDSVITGLEVERMLGEMGVGLRDFPPLPLRHLFPTGPAPLILTAHPGSGSGGYADFVLRQAAKRMGVPEVEGGVWKEGRSVTPHSPPTPPTF
jgi:iron only hydrogenase large subunit-like protein